MSERGVTYGIESRGLFIVSILRLGTKFGHDGRYEYGTVTRYCNECRGDVDGGREFKFINKHMSQTLRF